MYEWLGVEKAELAVVTELLLRGAQTVGDLRGRAARMEPIPGLSELMPIVDSLVAKGLVEYLSPPGRGAVVTHTFYNENERDKICREFGLGSGPQAAAPRPAASSPVAPPAASADGSQSVAVASGPTASGRDWEFELLELREELTTQISELRQEVERLRQRVEG